ncbi:MAG: peptidase S8, partial [Thermus sp.]
MRKAWFLLPFFLLACTPPGPSLSLFPSQALVGEEVEARLKGMTGLGARVFVGEVEAEVTLQEQERVRFRVPPVPGGSKPVRVVAGNQMAQGELGVLGTVDRNRILLRLPMGQDAKLPPGITLIRKEDLVGCGFALAELGYDGEALGKALEELEALDPSYKA